MGATGNDRVEATNSADIIIAAGKGDDRIQISENDGTGVASLLFNIGDGHDTINVVKNSSFNSQPLNTSLMFGGGVNPNLLIFSSTNRTYQDYQPFGGGWVTRTVTDLNIGYGTQGDSIVVEGGLDASASFEFADGHRYSYGQMRLLSLGLLGGTIISGGSQGTTYQYSAGSGSQVINGNSVVVGSRVSFGAGIAPSTLSLGLGSLLIRTGNVGDELHITGFDPNDAYASSPVQSFEFADGTTLSYSQLIDMGFDLKGSAGDDIITGTSAIDRIEGDAGNDTLSGGAGNDILNGGAGNDTYVFGYGDGVDRIYDNDLSANIDTVSFKDSVHPGDIEIVRNGDDLELHLAGSADVLVLSNWCAGSAYRVEQVQFADGTVWDTTYLQAQVPVLPVVGTEGDDTLYAQDGVGDSIFGLGGNDVLVGGLGNDTLDGGNGNDTLDGGAGNDVYLFNQGGGQDLLYDGDATAGNSDTIRFGAGVVANDVSFAIQGADLVLSIAGTTDQLILQKWGWGNDYHVERVEFADGSVWDDAYLQERFFAIPVADGWSYSSNGSPSYHSSDGLGNTTMTHFTLNSDGSSYIPVNQSWLNSNGNYGNITFNADGSQSGSSYHNTDGSYGSYAFNADGSSSGSTHNADGSYSTHTNDGQGTYNSFEYAANGNLAFSYTSTNVYDSNGVLTSSYYSENNYDANGNLIGSYTNTDNYGDYGLVSSSWQSSDGSRGSDIYNADGSCIGTSYSADGSYYIYTNDGMGNSSEENYDANGIKISDSWIKADGTHGIDAFNADGSSTGTIYQVDGSYSTYTNDGLGHIVTVNFDAYGNPTNSAPLLSKALAEIAGQQGQIFSFTIPSTTFIDPNVGDTLVLSIAMADGSALPSWLSFDSTTQTFSGTPSNAEVGNLGIVVTATDSGGLSVSTAFNLSVANVNDAPVVTMQIADQLLAQGSSLNLALPAGMFTDQDFIHGDSLTYSATLADGTPLPTWLSIDSTTGSLSGTAGVGDLGAVSIAITATDLGGLSATAQFNLTVANVITGTIYNDTLNGTTGADFIQSLAGNDVVNAGDGNDVIVGGAGSDVLSGGAGDDIFKISGTDAAYDRFQGDAGFDSIVGGDANDTIRVNYFSGASTVELIDGGLGLNVVAGSQYNDTIDMSGTELINIANIDGGVGNDVITGSSGNDTIIGGVGSDVLSGGFGDDTFLINGTDTAYDRFQGGDGFDVVLGGSADDTIRVNYFSGASTVEQIDGGAGLNIIAGSQYNDTIDLAGTELVNIANIDGGIGNDVITGSAGNDIIIGGAGSDVLAGGLGDDTFIVSGADTAYDRFQGDAGYDVIQGDAGDDTFRVNYFSGASTVEKIDGGLGINVIAGSQYNDTLDLSGTELVNIANIDGGIGNDVITGSAGSDFIIGGVGSDVLAGGTGDDTFLVNGSDVSYDRFQGDSGYDVIQGGVQDDVIRVNYFSGASTVEKIDGGAGFNTIEGSQYNDTIDLAGTELTNIAHIDGGIGNDVITGSIGNDFIIGGSGSDVLAGGAGDDIFQINGNDTAYDRFQGDAGFDAIQGGAGDDVIRVNYFTGASTVERIDGGAGLNVIAGSQYNDTMDLSGTELINIGKIDGGVGNDVITGSAGNDILQGGLGSDRLLDTSGNNILDGGDGADVLTGGVGNELFIGGTGYDTITTGNGADILAFNRGDGMDTVYGGIGTDNTISLGKGINYADIALSKVNNNLILEVGAGEQITLTNWYNTAANYKSVIDLQVMADAMTAFDATSADPLLNQAVQNFDFTAIVNAFDQAHGGSATYLHWSATNSLLTSHLSGSDTTALGGDLAHQYGTVGTLAGMNLTSAQTALNDPQFGAAQTLRPLQGLQGGALTL